MRDGMRTALAGLAVLLCSTHARAQARIDFDGGRGARQLMDAVREGTAAVAVPPGVAYAGDQGGGHLGYWNGERVKQLAHEVSQKAEHAHHEAERRAHHGDHDDERALRDLDILQRNAEHFHRQLERYWQDPSHTRSDYHGLVDVYRQARSSIRYSHAETHVRRDFDALGRALDELDFFYRVGNRDDDHGRGDRGGHGRDRRRPGHGFPW